MVRSNPPRLSIPWVLNSGLSLFATDLNGDGKLDLITVQESADTYTVMLGNGDGTFQSGAVYSVGSGLFLTNYRWAILTPTANYDLVFQQHKR